MQWSDEDKGMIELQWKRLQAKLKEQFHEAPDLNAMLMLIGIQEVGILKKKYTKEQKQDLMHVAVCTLLGQEGFYEKIGWDDDGWPHFEPTKLLPTLSLDEQELLLKRNVVHYFEEEQGVG